MDADHEWTPVVSAADCTPCPGCGEPTCPRCNLHYAECPCPGPSQDDVFYYREIDGKLHAIPRDGELLPDDDREPAEDFDGEIMAGDDYEGPEPDDEDGEEEIPLLDRLELTDLDEFDIGGEG